MWSRDISGEHDIVDMFAELTHTTLGYISWAAEAALLSWLTWRQQQPADPQHLCLEDTKATGM